MLVSRDPKKKGKAARGEKMLLSEAQKHKGFL